MGIFSYYINHTILRIDNSECCVIYTFDHNSETALVIITCDILKKREYFSLPFDISVTLIKSDLIFTQFFSFFTFIF